MFATALLCVRLALAAPAQAAPLPRPGPGHPWLGILAADAAGPGRDLGIKTAGVLVLGVRAGSPADRAGLRAGDVLVALGDRSLPDRNALEGLLAGLPAGEKIALRLLRGSKPLTLQALPAERKAAAAYLQPPKRRAARSWTVGPEGSEDFRTLSAALLRAQPGDTLRLKPGRYPEAVLFRNGVRIIGDPGKTTIEGLDGRAGPRDVAIEGLTIEADGGRPAVDLSGAKGVSFTQVRFLHGLWGLSLKNSQVSVRGSVLERNAGGLWARRSRVDILDSWIVDNLPPDRPKGERATADVLLDSSAADILRTTIANSRRAPGDFYGLELRNGSRLTLSRCVVAGHRAWLNLRTVRGAGTRIENNVFFDNGGPGGKDLPPSNRTVDPLFADAAAGDFRLSSNSPLWRGQEPSAGAPHLKPPRQD